MKDSIEINKLNSIIKPKIAHKAIHHVISRVEQFNRQYFPLEIRLVGIGGSCLRNEDPRDVDLLVEAYGIRERWEEWQEFKKCLNSKMYELYKLPFDLHWVEIRVTINKIIERAKDKLLALGFKSTWIENWLPWVRISDIRWGLDRGLLITTFSEKELISRFIKSGWGGKKLEIHVKYFDPDGDMKNMRIDVPFITIWMSEKGIIIPANKALNNFLQEEHDELTKLSKKIIEILETKGDQFFEGIPEIYHPTIFMIKENDEGEHFRNAKTEFRKLALSEINDIIKVVEIDNELAETNTRLRKHLKRFALIGRIYLKIMDIGYYNLLKIFKTDDIYTSLSEILSKRLIRDGYWKIDIEELLKLTNLDALSRDLMKIKSDREKKRV